MKGNRVRKPYQQGQALLVVVLILVVALTVGLSVATRSITNLRTTTQEDTSQRAFSAAEAGVEKLIKSNCTTAGNCASIANENLGDPNTNINAQAAAVLGTELLLKDGTTIFKDDGVDLWLSDPAGPYSNQWSGQYQIFWSSNSGSACKDAALELVLYYGSYSGSSSVPDVVRYVYDPCSSRIGTIGQDDGNHFFPAHTTSPGDTVSNKTFDYKTDVLQTPGSGYFMRIIPLYGNAVIGAKSSGDAFPSQGTVINSTGTYADTTRKVVYYQGYPSLPTEILSYILFVPN